MITRWACIPQRNPSLSEWINNGLEKMKPGVDSEGSRERCSVMAMKHQWSQCYSQKELGKSEDCTEGWRGKSSLHTQASQIVYLSPDKAETPAAIFGLSSTPSNQQNRKFNIKCRVWQPHSQEFLVPTTETITGGADKDHQMHKLCFTAKQVTTTDENKLTC